MILGTEVGLKIWGVYLILMAGLYQHGFIPMGQ